MEAALEEAESNIFEQTQRLKRNAEENGTLQ